MTVEASLIAATPTGYTQLITVYLRLFLVCQYCDTFEKLLKCQASSPVTYGSKLAYTQVCYPFYSHNLGTRMI